MAGSILCSRCKRLVDLGPFCSNCSAPLPKENPAVTRVLIIAALIAGAAVLIAIAANDTDKNRPRTAAAVSAPAGGLHGEQPNPAAVADPPRTAWSYGESEDQMTGKKIKTATVTSSNTFDLAFPYAGRQHATLTLRRRGGDNVLLNIEKGQLTCGDYSSRGLYVRFDERTARRFGVSAPSDHSSQVVFIDNEKSFIAEAKKAKRIRIEAVVYQNGSLVFDFDSAGLVW